MSSTATNKITSTKNLLLNKQLLFKNNKGITESGTHNGIEYKHILSISDAALGANFYCYKQEPEWSNLQVWASKSKGKTINFLGAGLRNMLRSEHIVYNIFYPLEKTRLTNPTLLANLLMSLFNGKINVTSVVKIKVEYASHVNKTQLLNDNTSFDAYIEYLDGINLCGIGIEMKYTEKSYPFGNTEEKMMNDPSSLYRTFTEKCKYYAPEKIECLKEKSLKQPWRNHLLGIKIVDEGLLKKFHSVLLYPKENSYQEKVCKDYSSCLNDNYKNTFLGLTLENFVEVAERELSTTLEKNSWLNYFKERY